MATEVVIPDRDDLKISEVCELTGVKPFVLRYWETEFPELAPAKGAGGQRSYTRSDVQLILRIKHLLYEERFTVAGAKKRLAEEVRPVVAVSPPPAVDSPAPEKVERVIRVLAEARRELAELVEILKK
ncbi:MAG TPA: MerR family transcriptional regulator [Thermoanaerobaculaceae bacterium]|nr:MerR family transcriptional regulator [Thermoanaerobaculaceae bacterium]HRS14668.1 MerR family transcriptional regulator [Thermoanaerobaculaceae bacterium]